MTGAVRGAEVDKFNLTFNGEILDGFELTEVKKHFAAALLIDDPERVELFFSGKAVTIRRNIDKDAAAAFYTKMYRVGAVLKLEPSRPKPFDESSKPGVQHEFRKERPGSVDQSWPIPSSNPRVKKTPSPPIDKPGNAVKEAQERERKQALEENKRLSEEESARIDAEKKRLHEEEVARIKAKRKAEEAAAVQAEEKRKRDEEAAQVKAEKKRIKAEETAKRKALALAEKKRAAEEAAKTRAEEKRQRDEEAARVKAEQKRIKAEEAARVKAEKKRIKAEEAAKRKAEALAAKHRAAEETARALAEEERKREEEAARAQIAEEARLAAEKERMLALEIAREEAEKAALREQTVALDAKKKANEERAIQAALDEIARKKAEEEASIQHALELEARKKAKKEEAKLRAELAVQKRKNAQQAARAKADEERIEDALRALATQRKNEENNRNLSLKKDQQRQLDLEESHKTQQRLAQEEAAERRAQERLMEQEALQRAAAGTARLEELQRTSQANSQSTPSKAGKASTRAPKTPPRKPDSAAPSAKKVSPGSTISPALSGGKRQSGEPNLFNLKPFRNTAEIRQRAAASLQLMKVMYIASVVSLLTLLILSARYALLPTPGPGVTHADKILANQQSSLFIAAGDELFVLDRSGTDSNRYRFADLGIDSGATLLAFENSGRLLVQTKAAAGTEAPSNTTRLLRCNLKIPTCEAFAADLPNGKISDWTTDTRTGDSFVAIAGENSLSRLAQDGSLISQQTVTMSSGAKLIFHEGLLYMNSSTDPAIGVFRPDTKGFGEQLDEILLLPQQAQELGHTQVNDFLWSTHSWWVIMSNPDTHSRALYRFNADWKFLSTIIMEPKSVPQQLLAWSNKILVVERTRSDIARFNSDGQAELPLTPKALASDITLKQASLIQSRRLWYACLGFLALLGVVTYVLGRLHQLRALVYRQDNVRGAEPIDDKVKAIHWIDLDRRKMPAFKQISILLATTAILVIGTLIYLIAPINVVMAVIILFSGPAIALTLLATSRPGHIGVLDDSLILVDHNNNYHIDHGARIHYRNNFLLLDDIALYVGNKLLPVFSTEQLAQNIAPLARAGVKVDRKTVLVKLGQNSHPLSRGLIACAAALGGALFCLLLY